MCIGIPMQVMHATEGMAQCGHAGALRTVRTSLVGQVEPGEWVLVFLDDAVERLDAVRAHEILQTLALLDSAMHGGAADSEAAFALPSQLSRDALAHLTR